VFQEFQELLLLLLLLPVPNEHDHLLPAVLLLLFWEELDTKVQTSELKEHSSPSSQCLL
jgi:hypothetical protein